MELGKTSLLNCKGSVTHERVVDCQGRFLILKLFYLNKCQTIDPSNAVIMAKNQPRSPQGGFFGHSQVVLFSTFRSTQAFSVILYVICDIDKLVTRVCFCPTVIATCE